MTEHEQNLRDLAAMFALAGLIISDQEPNIRAAANKAYQYADHLLAARDPEPAADEGGLVAIKPTRKRKEP